jgi:hypothetical protein
MPKKRKKKRRFSRKELIQALGLSPESRKRGDRYDAPTSHFLKRIKTEYSPRAIKAREELGLSRK